MGTKKILAGFTCAILAAAGISAIPAAADVTYSPLPQKDMKAVYVSSEDTSESPGTKESTLDGNKATYWHSDWHTPAKAPHYLAYDLGASVQNLGRVSLTPRQSNSSGRLRDYAISVSTNSACSSADKTFVETSANWTQVAAGTVAKDTTSARFNDIVIDFPAVEARCVLVTYKNSYGSDGSEMTDSSLAEFNAATSVTNPGRTWYVAADGDDSNDGLSPEKAWKTTAPVNQLVLSAGDAVYFHRGDVFNDQFLHLKGAGSAQKPIKISAYGDSSKPLPVINTNGKGTWYEDYHTKLDSSSHRFKGTVSSSVLLKDVEYIEVSHLEITNDRQDTDPGKYNDVDAMNRTGVAVIAENIGTVNHVVLKDLYIHDVDGNVYDKHMANGGIYVIAHKPLNEAATGIARFDDVQVLNNRVERVNRWGIGVGYTGYSAQFAKAEISHETAQTYGQTNVVVRGNFVKDAGGDAITVFYADKPLVEYNVSDGAARQMNLTDYSHTSSHRVAAAIWAWKTKNALFQYNEAYDTKNAAQGNGDGMAWDADYGDGTVYQYNYSHGNSGGSVMFCGQQVLNSTYRFNISQNDLLGAIDVPDNLPEAHIYNNTFYIPEGVPVLHSKHNENGNAQIENNIFYYAGNSPRTENWHKGSGTKEYENNLYYNYANIPANDTHPIRVAAGTKVMENPGSGPIAAKQDFTTHFAPGAAAQSSAGLETGAFDGYKLVEGSPAANMGMPITDAHGFSFSKDFLGATISGTPDIGAIQIDGEAPKPETTPDDPNRPTLIKGDSHSWVKDFENNKQGPVWYSQYQPSADAPWKDITSYGKQGYPNWEVDQWFGPGLDYRDVNLPAADARASIHGLLSDSPQSAGATAMVFKAPKDGKVTFEISQGEPYLRQADNSGGSVKLSLMHNDQELQTETLQNSFEVPAQWKNFADADSVIDVKKGDYIRVVAQSIGNPKKPSIHISPVITYVTVKAPAAVIDPIPNVEAGVGSAIADIDLSVRNGSVTAVEGLPDGVQFEAANAVISGTPTAAGTYTVTVKAVNADGVEAVTSFTIEVKDKSASVKPDPQPDHPEDSQQGGDSEKTQSNPDTSSKADSSAKKVAGVKEMANTGLNMAWAAALAFVLLAGGALVLTRRRLNQI